MTRIGLEQDIDSHSVEYQIECRTNITIFQFSNNLNHHLLTVRYTHTHAFIPNPSFLHPHNVLVKTSLVHDPPPSPPFPEIGPHLQFYHRLLLHFLKHGAIPRLQSVVYRKPAPVPTQTVFRRQETHLPRHAPVAAKNYEFVFFGRHVVAAKRALQRLWTRKCTQKINKNKLKSNGYYSSSLLHFDRLNDQT